VSGRRRTVWLTGLLALAGVACARPGPPAPPEPAPVASAPPPTPPAPLPAPPAETPSREPLLLISEPDELARIEKAGLTFDRQIRAPGEDGEKLLRSPLYASFVSWIAKDVKELSARDAVALRPFPIDYDRFNFPFRVEWLGSPRARFQLVGVAHRLDLRFLTPGRCGQLRLIYRLLLAPPGRPVARLPMTINVIRELPAPGAGSCRDVARQWRALRSTPAGREAALAKLIAALPAPSRLETNYQNLHGPGTPDNDDHAEYVLRSFDVRGDRLVPRRLVNTPRPDLAASDRRALARWIVENFRQIDGGSPVVPDRFLATRAVSVSPRGLARPGNRPFAALFAGAEASAFAALPFESAAIIRSPRGLLRRLDELTCTGCHQSRALAGFHLPGEEREGAGTFNTLAVGVSPHLHDDLPWRARYFESVESGAPFAEPRPFAERANVGDGSFGAHCGRGDPTFARWTCDAGLRCRDAYHDDVGFCAPVVLDGGDACEDVRVVARAGANGDAKVPDAPERCAQDPAGNDRCVGNKYGFPFGLCTEACKTPGARHGSAVCESMLVSGYEDACFQVSERIEDCVRRRNLITDQTTRFCSREEPCRDDYACVRYPGCAPGAGGCLPPYFLFSFRVDGPLLDR
jgi:hypothetical protein